MNKNTLVQITIATASTVAAGLILDYFKKKQQVNAPIVNNEKSWWEF